MSKIAPPELHTGKDATIPVRYNRWPSIIFLTGITLFAVIGCPLYLYLYGIDYRTVILTVVLAFATTLGIACGYHRLYSHKSYQAGKLFQFVMLALGAATFQQSALKWASLHRTHHQYTDTERDPYNIKKGFFYAHVGWILFWLRNIDFDNVQDLSRNQLVMHQHRHFQRWALGFGVVLPGVIGALYGHAFEALLFGVAGRLFIVFHATFFINSFAHTFGQRPYDKTISARDNWIGAILTGGEGYHNFHHKFPTDYRNGYRWYHLDPNKWFIWLANKLGWTWNLKKTPPDRIKPLRN